MTPNATLTRCFAGQRRQLDQAGLRRELLAHRLLSLASGVEPFSTPLRWRAHTARMELSM